MKNKLKIPLIFGFVGVGFLLGRPERTPVIFGDYYGGGVGTESDPYLISTPEHLKRFNEDIMINQVNTSGVYYRLTADIDFSGYDTDDDETNGNWLPVGSNTTPFRGIFDGNEYVISNLTVDRQEDTYGGFFGYVRGARIQKLALEDLSIKVKTYAGGLVGYADGLVVEEVKTSGFVLGKTSAKVGGVIGYGKNVTAENNYSLASVDTPTVNSDTGGFASYLSGNIENNYYSGNLDLYDHGGFVHSFSGTASGNYWDIDVTGGSRSSVGLGIGNSGLTTDLAYHVLIGFDFDNVWKVCEGETPSFKWENKGCREIPKTDIRLNGSGSSDDPYQINNANDLIYFNHYVSSGMQPYTYFELNSDIDLSGYDTDSDASNGNWKPVGNKLNPFKGGFNGNGHTVSNVEIVLPNKSYTGFFGYVTNAQIQSLVLEDVLIEGQNYVGGLIGYQDKGQVTQVKVSGSISGSGSEAGGLVGEGNSANINQSYNLASVSSSKSSSNYTYTGGLVGKMKGGTISESYSTGKVVGRNYVGGLVGGTTSSPTITNSYWDVGSSGRNSSYGGSAVSEKGLKTELAYHVLKGFDFNQTWKLCEDSTVSFKWENLGCQEVAKTSFGLEGDGVEENPYLIKTEDDLIYFNYYINAGGQSKDLYFLLTNDLDLGNYDTDEDETNGNWLPVGSEANHFQGRFDGGGHIISNIEVLLPNKSYTGFFGYTTDAQIQSLVLEDILIEGYSYVGGLIGYQDKGQVIQVKVSGSISGNGTNAGGLIGKGNLANINQSYSLASVSSSKSSSNYTYTGGLVGEMTGGTINESYSTGKVVGRNYVGGLIGGTTSSPTITNSYWDADSSGQSTSKGGNAVREKGLKTELAYHVLKGFDFDQTWKLCEGEVPQFRWEVSDCQEVAKTSFGLEGDGVEENPYLIKTEEDLIYFSHYINAGGQSKNLYFLLTNDLDVSGYDTDEDEANGNWLPVGSEANKFQGTFDGGEHTISNVKILLPDKNYVGFFGYTNAAQIQSLALEDILIEGRSHVGGLIGYQDKGQVTQANVSGSVSGDGSYAGGLIGEGNSANINQSYSLASVSSSKSSSTYTYTGGLVGKMNGGTINESYSTGKVVGKNYYGGLVGHVDTSPTVTHSYWDADSSGQSTSKGGLPIGPSAVKTELAYHQLKGFDFENTWKLCEGLTIGFKWENKGCQEIVKASFRLEGDGTEESPYLIQTEEDLIYFNHYINAGIQSGNLYFLLTNDLDLNGYDTDDDPSNGNWKPLGNKVVPFQGTFDGGEHTISNVKVLLPDKNYVGFFGYTNAAQIQSLALEDILIEGRSYAGGLIGYQNKGQVAQVKISGTVLGNATYAGGLVAYGDSSNINQSYSLATVDSSGNKSTYTYTGGLVGNMKGGTVSQSYSIGKVVGRVYVGGLVGYSASSPTVTHSYWDADSSGQSSSKGGKSLITEQMKGKNAPINMVGFDFDTVWQITKDDYPTFKWEFNKANQGGSEEADVTVVGEIQPTILSITIPSNALSFSIDPNQVEGKRFIASEFELFNDSYVPIAVSLREFEQLTNAVNDVLPTKYPSWDSLSKKESKDFALGLKPITSDGWLTVDEQISWVSDFVERELGVIKGQSSVSFGFVAYHGLAFTDSINLVYQLNFVFEMKP